jgi:hypothetical protein
MVGARKESRLWDALNNTDSEIKALTICEAFRLTKDEQDEAISLWNTKRTMQRNRIVF